MTGETPGVVRSFARVRIAAVLSMLAAMPGVRAEVRLPVEVMFPEGTSVAVSLTTTAPASELAFSLHGIEFEGEASVQVGQAPPVPVTNASVRLRGPGLARAFPIGTSDVSYYDMSLPVEVGAGAVTLRFRLEHVSERVSGFRVVREI